MSVEVPARSQASPATGSPGSPGRRRFRPLASVAGAAMALAVVACAALLAVWPMLTLLALALVLVALLAWRAPPFAVVAVILLYGLEGSVKVGLAPELSRMGVAPDAVGAGVIDLALLVAVAGLVRLDRGRSLLAIWRNAGRWARISLVMLGTWLVLSLLQMSLTGDLGTALAGFRLTQAYLVAALAGAMLMGRWRSDQVLTALAAVLLVVAVYAAFRTIAGPADGERLEAFSRSTTPLVPAEEGVIFRTTGSFSSAIGLVSYLVPAGIFLLTLGLFMVRLRLAAWVGVALVLFALVGTYVRMSLLATALGAVCVAALVVLTSSLSRSRKFVLGLATAPLLVVLLVVGALAPVSVSGGSKEVEERSAGVLDPRSDASLALRLERWRDSLDVVGAHPLGTGVGTVGGATVSADSPGTFVDNSYLKILQEQGPLGALAFALGVFGSLIAVAAGLVRRSGAQRACGVGALGASASFFALALTSEAIEQPGKVLAWLLFGVALWSAFGPAQDEHEPRPQAAS